VTDALSEAKAEIARLQKENDEWRRDYDRGTKMSDLSAEVRSEINHWRGRAEKAEAEIARLTAENQRFKELIESEKAWLRSLEPDTGETP
jgi:predicted  nucleic acid-binding Zn-ribbon protein